jgi:hypothetical protein
VRPVSHRLFCLSHPVKCLSGGVKAFKSLRNVPGLSQRVACPDRYLTVWRQFSKFGPVAVFCDGSHHARPKQKAKDVAINAKLEAVGIRADRAP